MKNYKSSVAPIIKGDKFRVNRCPKNVLEQEQMKYIPHVCTGLH